MPTIRLKVENKKVVALEEYCIVNYNKDYEVEFSFDEEWNDKNFKTARFIFAGKCVDVVFEGNVCQMPMIKNATNVGIGVYSGDLKSTTKAHIKTLRSVLDECGLPADPTDSVYAQIIDLLNKYISGETGEITEEKVKQIVNDAVKDFPTAITASVDESTNALTVALKDKEEKVVSSATVTLPSNESGGSEITQETFNDMLVEGLTANGNTLTDEEQKTACAWLGATKLYAHNITDGYGFKFQVITNTDTKIERTNLNNIIVGNDKYVQIVSVNVFFATLTTGVTINAMVNAQLLQGLRLLYWDYNTTPPTPIIHSIGGFTAYDEPYEI